MCEKAKTDKPVWQIKKEEAKARKAAAAANPEKTCYDICVENREYFIENLKIISRGFNDISAAASHIASAADHILSQIYYKPVK